MPVVRDAAPEIDRLVLSVHRSVDREVLAPLVVQAGLDDLDLLWHWWDFLLAGVLTPEIAERRSRYRPVAQVQARIARLTQAGLVVAGPAGLAATDTLQPVLHGMADQFVARAASAWGNHPDAVATATAAADQLADAATDEHAVAVIHRDVPRLEDPCGGLYQRLVTVRYIRQQDHVDAWSRHGLTAAQMVALTTLWHQEVDADRDVVDVLVDRGLVDRERLALTGEGRDLREQIEDDTNRRAEVTFGVLEDGGQDLLAALQALPSATPA